jgi:predicted alpha-1,2-mannosidase
MRKSSGLLTGMGMAFLVLVSSCQSEPKAESAIELSPVDYVNPYMGNISHLLVPTFPTVHLPNSMLRITPRRGDYTSVKMDGLPLILTSHRGHSAFSLAPGAGTFGGLDQAFSLSYDQETITPYSYSVFLDEQGVQVDFGLSAQAAVYEFTFPGDLDPYLVLRTGNGSLRWDGEKILGYEDIGNHTRVYICLTPEVLPERVASSGGTGSTQTNRVEGNNAGLLLRFENGISALRVRYGISFIDEEQAAANMKREVQDATVEGLNREGRKVWNEALGKIQVEGGSEDDRAVFYTSLYRTYERSVNISEDGRYFSGFDGKVHEDGGRPFYTDDWIWDSYRAHHPLRLLLDPDMEADIIRSLILMAGQDEYFWMPTFPRINGDAHAMNSNHGVATVLDAYVKGIRDFDLEKAYLASKGAITEKTLAPWSGMPAGELDAFYWEHGYIPALPAGREEWIPEVHHFEKRQPIAVSLGTAYDLWCLSEIASILGKDEDAAYFGERSFNYRKLFHPETAFFHPKEASGDFVEPFDYRFSGGMGAREYYDENNGWIYRWDVPHNIPDLIRLMGGNEAFVANLDAMFEEPLGRSKYAFYAQLPDHTGNVGQFSMANEPSLHIPYLYNYAGQPWRTQKCVRDLVDTWFRNDLMGVPGDEDGGGMSAFVVFSQMGFYPVTPGKAEYSIGSPVFENIRVRLGNGNIFEVIATNASPTHKYIQSATLNGVELDQPVLPHEALAGGGKLVLEMGPVANKSWGTATHQENEPE